jgi:hypothetical protein
MPPHGDARRGRDMARVNFRGDTVVSKKPVPQLQQCSFCRQGVPMGQCVCLSCGAQQRVVEIEGSIFLCFLAMTAFAVITGFAVYFSFHGGGLLAALPIALGAPEWVAYTAMLVGWLATLVGVPVVAWKVLMGAWNKLTKRHLVWSRGGDIMPMRPMT